MHSSFEKEPRWAQACPSPPLLGWQTERSTSAAETRHSNSTRKSHLPQEESWQFKITEPIREMKVRMPIRTRKQQKKMWKEFPYFYPQAGCVMTSHLWEREQLRPRFLPTEKHNWTVLKSQLKTEQRWKVSLSIKGNQPKTQKTNPRKFSQNSKKNVKRLSWL